MTLLLCFTVCRVNMHCTICWVDTRYEVHLGAELAREWRWWLPEWSTTSLGHRSELHIMYKKRVSWPPASTFGKNWTNTCVGQQCNLHTTRKYNHDAANTCNIVFRGRTEGSSRGAEGILAPGQVAVNLRSYQLDSTFATVRQVWNRCMWNGNSHFSCNFVLKKVINTKQ